MKTFNVNTDQLIVRFPCPKCDCTIEEDVSSIVPEANFGADFATESENSDEVEVECEECGTSFIIEVFKNFYEGNVRVTVQADNGHVEEIDDDDIELEEFESPDYEDDDE